MSRRRLLVLLVALPLLLASSCRLTGFFYNRAEWLALREIDKTICPAPTPRAELKQALHELLVWHRRSELPRYARLLRQVADGLQRPVTRELMRSTRQELEQAWRRAEQQVEARLIAIGLSLGKREASCQAQSLIRGRNEDQAREQRESPTAFRVRQRKETASKLEGWVGDLSDAQLALLGQLLPTRDEASAAARARFNRGLRLVSALESTDAAKKRAWLRALLTDSYALQTREERQLLERQSDRNQERIFQLLQTLTQAQRDRAARKLREYASDFDELAKP